MDAGWRKPLYFSDQILQVINITHSLSPVDAQSVYSLRAMAGIGLYVLLLVRHSYL